jgi:hypothetical protein
MGCFERIGIRRPTVGSVGIMQRLSARIAKQLAEFRNNNTEPDYEEQARIILLIVNEERQAEIREWRSRMSKFGVIPGRNRRGRRNAVSWQRAP